MKKFTALLLSLILLCGIFTVSASAATNYCEEFDKEIYDLEVCMGEDNAVSENESFPAEVIVEYVRGKTSNKSEYGIDFDEKTEEYRNEAIPAEIFETKAKEKFSHVDINALRSTQVEVYDNNNKKTYRQCYNSELNAYVFATTSWMIRLQNPYKIFGYTVAGDKYMVYSASRGSQIYDIDESMIEGKDYITVNEKNYHIEKRLKTIVSINNGKVRFHSWQTVDTFPLKGLTRPIGANKEEATSSQVTSSDISSVVSDTSSATSSESNITSNVITGNAPVTNITQIIYVNVENVTVESVTNVFPEGTVVNVVMVTDEAQLQVVKTALKELTQKFVAYDITAKSDNVTVQPDGTVKATFAIPEGYDHSKVGVIYVSDDGKTETVPSVVNKETGKVVAQLSHFSTYAVVELNEAPVTDEAKAGMPAFAWVLIFVGIILVLGGGGTALYFLYFKKKGIIK